MRLLVYKDFLIAGVIHSIIVMGLSYYVFEPVVPKVITVAAQFMTYKHYLDANELLNDSFRLANKVYQSGFRPSFIMALWRGGAPMGLPVQEYFAVKGIPTDHILVRTSSYSGIDNQSRDVPNFGLSYLVKRLSADDKVLIVDDVYDTGRTIHTIKRRDGREPETQHAHRYSRCRSVLQADPQRDR